MFGIFKKDPTKRLEKAYLAKLEEARDAQRAGDIQAFAALSNEAEKIRLDLEEQGVMV